MNKETTDPVEKGWPRGIILAYVIFVTATLGFVAFTFTVDFDLVAPDYYQQTLTYQKKIDSKFNAQQLDEPLQYSMIGEALQLVYPAGHMETGLEGSIKFYRPSDASLDLRYAVLPGEGNVQLVDMSSLARGHWKVQVDWISEGIEYSVEFPVFLR